MNVSYRVPQGQGYASVTPLCGQGLVEAVGLQQYWSNDKMLFTFHSSQ